MKLVCLLSLALSFTLTSTANARPDKDPFAELEEGADKIANQCGGRGGKIIEKVVIKNGVKSTEEVVLCSDSGAAGATGAVNKRETEVAKEERRSSLECLVVDKYLFCNDNHFYEPVSAITEVQLHQLSKKILDKSRPAEKGRERVSPSESFDKNSAK